MWNDQTRLKDAFNSHALAHLCIDTQVDFYSFRDQTRIAYRQAAVMAEMCREAHIPNIWAAFARSLPLRGQDKFFIAEPAAGEPVFIKNACSAFSNLDLDKYLKAHGYTMLLVSGVAAWACVRESIAEALSLNYAVAAVTDAINLTMQTDLGVASMYGYDVLPTDTNRAGQIFGVQPEPLFAPL